MEVHIGRKCLLLIFLSTMYQHSIGQCPDGPENKVLRVGENWKFTQRNPNSEWRMMPSNSFYNSVQRVTNSSTLKLAEAFVGALLYDPTGLTILTASPIPVGKALWSTAGLYVMQDKNAKCNSSAKVAVVESGPTCKCNSSRKNTPADFTCSMTYADSPAIPMYPQCTWISANKKNQITEQPLARRIDKYRYRMVCAFPVMVKGHRVGGWTPKTCVVNFQAPSKGRWPTIATNAPSYSDSCTFNCN